MCVCVRARVCICYAKAVRSVVLVHANFLSVTLVRVALCVIVSVRACKSIFTIFEKGDEKVHLTLEDDFMES